jgi:hypothetical protein
MPRKMPAGLMERLARKDKQIVTHTTLQVSINTETVVKSYYFASAQLNALGIVWHPLIKSGSQIRASLERSSDIATVELHNVDTEIGKEFLSLGQSLYSAETKVSRYWRDQVDGSEYLKVFHTGVLVGLRVDENVVRLTAVSEPYAPISVGATRRVAPLCQWTYADPSTCGHDGSKIICNFMLNDEGGCQGRHGDPLKRAKYGGMAYLNSGSRLKTI